MTRSLAFVLSSMVALFACGQDFSSAPGEGGTSQGAGTTSSSGTGGSTTSSGVGGSGDCPDETAYAPPAPVGWEGPVIIAENADESLLPECPESSGDVLRQNLQGDGPASCKCTCGSPNAEHCSATVDLWTGGTADCAGSPADSITYAPGCNQGGGTIGTSAKWLSTPPAPGACEPSAPTELVPEVSWELNMVVCEVTPVSEGGDQCAPLSDGFDSSACVVTQGSESCPAGYPVLRTGFSGWTDDRDCADDCGCDGSGVNCGGNIWLHTSPDCNTGDANKQQVNTGSCFTSVNGQAIGSVAYLPYANGDCAPVDATPIGSVLKTGLQTVCCTS